MQDDELAYKLVELYVQEVSKGHEKRQMGLDTLLNAYFYALLRIQRKNKEMSALSKAVDSEVQVLSKEYQPEEQPPAPTAQSPPAKKSEFSFD